MRSTCIKLCIAVVSLQAFAAAAAGDGKIRRAVKAVPEEYIVRIDKDSTGTLNREKAQLFASEFEGTLKSVFVYATHAIHVRLTAAQAERISKDPRVVSVEEVAIGGTSSAEDLWNLHRVSQRGALTEDQTSALSQSPNTSLTGAGVTAYILDSGILPTHSEFTYETSIGGATVTVSRVKRGINYSDDGTGEPFEYEGVSRSYGDDPHGNYGYTKARFVSERASHGTSVASVLGGKTVGIAKEVTLVPVKIVAQNANTTSDKFVKGVEWIIKDCGGTAELGCTRNLPAIANFSGYYEFHPSNDLNAVDEAAIALERKNIQLFTAGSNHADQVVTIVTGQSSKEVDLGACETSPQRLGFRGENPLGTGLNVVITVGGSARRDRNGDGIREDVIWRCENDPYCLTVPNSTAKFGSNTGACISFFAPAFRIKSADLSSDNQPYLDLLQGSNTQTATLNPSAFRTQETSTGTSFASPLAAGTAALYLESDPTASAATVRKWMIDQTTPDAIADASLAPSKPNTTNRMLYAAFTPITRVRPVSASSAQLPSQLTIDGAKFTGAKIYFNGTQITPTVTVDGKSATFSLPANYSAAPGTVHSISTMLPSDASSGLPSGSFTKGFFVDFLDAYSNGASWVKYQYIQTLARLGVTSGCGGGNFCPLSPVYRGQLAVFIELARHGGTGFTPPPATGTIFSDVPSTHLFARYIELMYREGLTHGCTTGYFCPDSIVTRAQAATVIASAIFGRNYQFPPASGVYEDAPASNGHAKHIEALTRMNIVGACPVAGVKFCPDASITREDMAVWLVKAFRLQCGIGETCSTN